MLNIDMSKEWVKAAKVDLGVIHEIIDNDCLTTMTAFHAQQSIEKCLKALLELYNQEVPKVHSIQKLLKRTSEYITIDVSGEIIIKIDTLYIESRYPGDMGLLPYGEPTSKDATEFYELAKKIYNLVIKIVNSKEKI